MDQTYTPTRYRSTNSYTSLQDRFTGSGQLSYRTWLFIEEKKVWGRKQVQEPKRCLKCQCFGEHKAAKCASIHDVCGCCGSQHRTSLCAEEDKTKWECSNCKAAGNGSHKGHGAANRRCLIFLVRVDTLDRKTSTSTSAPPIQLRG